ncbi:MAG: TIGR04551 family protein [Myxococcales bacterium]
MRLHLTLALAIASASGLATADEAQAPSQTAVQGNEVNPLPETPALRAHDAALRAEILKEAQADTDAKVKKVKDELSDEMRAEMVTAGTSAPSEFEQLPVEKPKLSFLELNGYFRLRPNLYDDLWLGWTQPDKLGYWLFPKAYSDANTRTILSADTRFRIEPTFNVSEDIKIKSQFDVLDNVVLGSTPAGPFGDIAAGGGGQSFSLFSNSLNPPTATGNVLPNSIEAKRVWAEVTTPIGQLRFGRMGSHWGLGIFQNDGNCLDCDFGNTVDRINFIAKIYGFYLIPMIDFVSSGPLANPYSGDQLGQPVAIDHNLEAYEYVLVFAKKDSDEELRRHIEEGTASLNYGFYGVYRNESNELMISGLPPANGPNSTGTAVAAGGPGQLTSGAIDARNASIFTPDLWFRYQTKRLRLEAEALYLYGTFDTFWNDTMEHPITMNQWAGAVQGDYHFLADGSLTVGVEWGTASGSNSPGLINDPSRSTNPKGLVGPAAGEIGGLKYSCTPNVAGCSGVNYFNDFTFNRDYHVDMILWREILGGVTSAWYGKANIKYQIADGLDASLAAIYSEAWFAVSTPGDQVPLGLEFNGGVHYTTDDGFVASIDYGVLVPFSGLGETVNSLWVGPSVAQAVRIMLAVKY